MMCERRNMRTAVISHGFLPRVGGIESLLASLLPALKQHGIDPVLLTREYPGSPEYEEVGGVPVYRLPARGSRAAASLEFITGVLRLLRKLAPDVLHAHEFISPASAALLAKQLLGMPFVVTPHLSGPIGDVRKLERSFQGRMRLRMLRKQASIFQVISDAIGSELCDVGIPAAKQVRIRNGVDTARFKPLDPGARDELRREYQLDKGTKLLLFAGRLVPMKRLDLVLEAWPKILSRYPEVELMILGEGPLEGMIHQAGLPRLRYLGSQRDVVPFLQAADVLLMPSDSEGLPMMLLESMACGVPAAATPVGGIPQVVKDGETGRIIQRGDASGLADTVVEMLEDESSLRIMSGSARELICEGYSIDLAAARLADVYADLCSVGRGPC